MATRGGYGKPLDPDYEYPLAYRLAQFLLGSGEQLGQYTQGLGVQSKGASDVLESLERQDIARDELGRRTQADLFAKQSREEDVAFRREQLGETRRETDIKVAERAEAARERERKEALAQTERSGLAKLLFPKKVTETTQAPPAFAQDPERLMPGFLQALVQRPPTREEVVTQLTPEEAGHPEVLKQYGSLYPLPKAFEQPATAAPGTGVWNPVEKRYDVPVPKESKEPPAPSSERTAQLAAQALEKQKRQEPLSAEESAALSTYNLKVQTEKDVAGVRAATGLENQRALLEDRDRLERSRKADETQGELAQVKTIVDRMDTLVPKVNTPGFLGRAAGVTTRTLQEAAQTNPDINQLATLGKSYVTLISKIVQRQSGVLSNQDLERAELSVPLVSDNLEVAQNKLAVLKEMVASAERNLDRMRSGGPAPPAATTGGQGQAQFRYNPTTRTLEPVR